MGSSTKTTRYIPTAEQKAGTQGALSLAGQVRGDLANLGAFTGDFMAGQTPDEQRALAGTRGLALNLMRQPGMGAPLQLGLDTAAGNFLHPGSNPYLRGAIDAATQPVTENFLQNVLPSIRGTSASVGGFDNVRRGLVEAQAGNDYMRRVGDISKEMQLANYMGERQLQQNAPNMIMSGMQIQDLPNRLLLDAGAGMRAGEDLGLQNALARYQSQRQFAMDPLSVLPAYQAAISSPGGTKQTQGPSMAAQFLQGAFGGAGALKGLGLTNPWALAAGGLGAGALSLAG